MDQYLKDSPGEFGNVNRSNANSSNKANAVDNQFSLNLDQQFENPQSANFDGLETYQSHEDNYPVVPGAEYISPNNGDFSSSYQNDPFLDELDALEFPNHTSNYLQPVHSNTNNLDEIISPSGNYNDPDTFLNPQYFSPPGKNTVPNIRAIPADDGLRKTFSNEFSPDTGVGIPFQSTNNYDLNTGSYLSPSNSQYMSPTNGFDNSYDTLVSPNFNASYLNSPPNHIGLGPGLGNGGLQSTSIPNNTNHLNKLLSPQKPSVLGTSAPGPSSDISAGLNTKHLTKEEKLKRRREFHNAVERRRRDLIKERIKELGFLVPSSLLNPQLCAVQAFAKDSQLNSKEINELLSTVKVKDTKPNKSTILNKSVDYIHHLHYVLEQQRKTRLELQNQINSLEGNGQLFNNTSSDQTPNSIIDSVKNEFSESETQDNPNFLQDFQNQGQYGQYIKQEDSTNFDPDEFFSEIITGNGNNQQQPSQQYY